MRPTVCSRTPQGVRGLKLNILQPEILVVQSHSARSAWIETVLVTNLADLLPVALRKECVD